MYSHEEDDWSRAERACREKREREQNGNAYHIANNSIAVSQYNSIAVQHKPYTIDHMLYAIRNGGKLPMDKSWHTPLWSLCKQLNRSGWEGDFKALTEAIRPATWQSLGLTPEAAELDFKASWESINEFGDDKVATAHKLSKLDPYETELIELQPLLSLCYYLKDENNEFFLSGKTVGELFGIHQGTGSYQLRKAVKLGYLEKVKEHVPRHKSITYRWIK